MNAVTRGLIAIPVISILGWGISVAVDVGRAKALILEAAQEMRTWSGPPDQGTWDSTRERLEAAGHIYDGDPTQRELLGLLGSLRLDRRDLMAGGESHLIAALKTRPTSAHTWAHLAEVRYRLGQPGAALELPLNRAVDLGPSEPGVQRLVADYGLAIWTEVTPPTQGAIDRMVAAGIRRNPLEMLQISERRGRLDAACRHFAKTSRQTSTRPGRLCPWEITP